MLDLLIRNARIVDGTGNPWYLADLGVQGDTIALIGRTAVEARTTVDAAGLVACPGFVDVHTHADRIVDAPGAENVLRQGVTTVVSGNCGMSRFPVGRFLDEVETAGPAINFATLVGHGTVRNRAMGAASDRTPTPQEVGEMRRLAEEAMDQGAVGLSSGLFYVPGAYADVDELVALSESVAARGGVYATHARSAGGKIFQAIEEAAEIGRRAGIGVEVSHLKVLHREGRTEDDRADKVLAAVEGARLAGVDLTYDVYPYTATSTSLAAVAIPPWVSEGGQLKARLREAAFRDRVREEVAGRIAWIGGAQSITIAQFEPDPSLAGLSLAEVARRRAVDEVATAMDLVVEGGASGVFHALRRDDVSTILCGESSIVASDGGVVPSRTGIVHPRHYGTFPRVLREYVREGRVMTLETAIRKMTSLPARRFGLRGRGLLTEGMKADIVLFDPETVTDHATFEDPHAFPEGVRWVIVNGHVAWDGRRVSGERAGTVIRRR